MLAVDIGNTFTRIVAFRGEVIGARRSFHTRDLEVTELMGAFAETASKADSSKVWVASVSPAANAIVDSAAERAGLPRRFIRPAVDSILPHRLATPQTTGVDRLLSAMAAGVRHFPKGAAPGGYVVVQCGSAATVDLVDGDGVFRGGYILPGPGLWLSGLSDAAQLPDLSGELPDWSAIAPGDNTRDAILHGMSAALPMAIASAAMLIDSFSERRAKGAADLPVAVTGGWGEAAMRFIRGRHLYDKDLQLHGIRIFAERNG